MSVSTRTFQVWKLLGADWDPNWVFKSSNPTPIDVSKIQDAFFSYLETTACKLYTFFMES